MVLDNLDKKIIKNLTVDARQSARQLALKLGVSTVTILSRMKKLEKGEIICGYTARIDHEKIGYSLTAIIEIIAKNDKIVDIENEYLQDVLFDPKHGYGKNFNPCIDCHAKMFTVAKRIMEAEGASFLISVRS